MSSSINRRTALATLGASLALANGLSAAQSFPTKTIRILIGAAAGGSDDPFMRVMIDKLGTVLGSESWQPRGAQGAGAQGWRTRCDRNGRPN